MEKSKDVKKQGGPCRRQCDVDSKTLICKSCDMYFGVVEN